MSQCLFEHKSGDSEMINKLMIIKTQEEPNIYPKPSKKAQQLLEFIRIHSTMLLDGLLTLLRNLIYE